MEWNTSLYDDKHGFVTKLGAGVLELLAPQPEERVLDIGCGTGHLAAQIAKSGAIVTGLDNSAEMISVARQTYPNIEFILADASTFTWDRTFDAIFSNAALHWVHRAEEAIVCMSRTLRPGGRFVVEFGGKGNVRRIYKALESSVLELTGRAITASNYFPSIAEYSTLLERHGLEVEQAHLFDRWTRLESGNEGLANWLRMFRRPVIESLDDASRSAVIDRVQSQLRSELYIGGTWHADYRRLRIVARKVSGDE